MARECGEQKTDDKKKIKGMLWRIIIFPLMCMYLELMFHVACYGNIRKEIVYPILFGMGIGMLIAVLSAIFPKRVNIVISHICVFLGSLFCVVQLVYYKIFDTFFSLVSVKGAEDAMNFKTVMFHKIGENIGYILAFFAPFILLIVLSIWKLDYERSSLKGNITGIIAMFCTFAIAVVSLNFDGKKMYSPYNLFFEKYVLELSMDKLGLAVTTVKDAMALAGHKDKSTSFTLNEDAVVLGTVEADYGDDGVTSQTAEDNKKIEGELATITDAEDVITYVPQIDESVDLKVLYNNTDDEDLKNLTAYFSNKVPTMENEYTGMFKDYNVVFVTAESLSKYGISDKCTPTLYKLMNDGFVFENFYNPRWYHSTIDGEYVNCLSQYPSSSDWSFNKSAETYQPYALGNALNQLGYKSYAYHDFNFYYYDRSKTHANMGYDFKAIDYGLEIPYNSVYSDLDTMEAVYDEFISQDKFNMYFMSFSGHLPYNYQYQAMSLKNKEEAESLTQGMNLSEEAVAYIAAQMELDKALGFLIEKLDEAGKLDKTVFIVAPDHYPYGLSDGTYNELAGKDIEDDKYELHKNSLEIWSTSMKEPIVVDKLCASVDILPTVLNLLGVNYDSRFLAGHDILSESEELVIFADHSFMTDKIRYDAATGKINYLVDEYKIPVDYVDTKITEVENILQMSDLMIDEDYLGYVYGK